MKRNALLISLVISSAFLFSVKYAGADTTSTGAQYTLRLDLIHPGEGPAWEAPNGNVWHYPIRRQDGSFIEMTLSEAMHECGTYGMRVPSAEDWVQLRKSMGYGSAQGYEPQILPDLEFNSFWTTQSVNGSPDYVYLFNGSTGEFKPESVVATNLVRCVKGVQDNP